MQVPAYWRSRLKFIAGVLLVWGTTSAVLRIGIDLWNADTVTSRLDDGQLCTVGDFKASDIFAPTTFYLFDRAYQQNPGVNPAEHMTQELIDIDTLVMATHDYGDPAIMKGEPGLRDVDTRLVGINIISGRYSGRTGLIARYKLSPLQN